ncbi:sugar phosphate isomerase/epimerase family protein [Ferdinandcohnia sp. Marseille-Q9671]
MTDIPVGIQMYTLRNECEKDFFGTLRKVAELGYDGVELAGLGGFTAQEVKEALDKLNLKVAGSHVSLAELETNLERVIEEQKVLGSQYLVCPYILPDQRNEESYKALISFLQEAGEVCLREGISLCYHNHDFELEPLSDGKTALESIFTNTNPEFVKAELDVYWLTKAGEDPVEWMQRYRNRTPLIHLKDMTLDEEKFFAELGTGGVNLEGILQIGKENGVKWWIVEQDECRRDPLESIKMSLDFLKMRK